VIKVLAPLEYQMNPRLMRRVPDTGLFSGVARVRRVTRRERASPSDSDDALRGRNERLAIGAKRSPDFADQGFRRRVADDRRGSRNRADTYAMRAAAS